MIKIMRRAFVSRIKVASFSTAQTNDPSLGAANDNVLGSVIATFGPDRRMNEDGALFRAEDLVKTWRTLFHPTTACGSRGYALAGIMADLENAILEYVHDYLENTGKFNVMHVDDILPLSTTKACGVGFMKIPTDEDEAHSHNNIQYFVNDKFGGLPQFCLSGTAEMGICHNLRGKVFLASELPIYYMAQSRCFRPEISQGARESGLYRVHEFNKIEMFAVCRKDQSDETLSNIVKIQQEIFTGLGIHCRIRDMPAEDLNVAAHQKFDIEAWMPGRNLWGEVSSASNCTDFQSKNLSIRYTDDGTREPEFAHTCNGTAVATSRALIAMLETHQQTKRKGVDIPEVIARRLPSKRSPILRMHNNPNPKYD